MTSWTTEADGVVAAERDRGSCSRTRVRVQVIPLCICALASSGFVAATNLPWFGDLSSTNPTPEFSAVSRGEFPSEGFGPGTPDWGHLLVAWSTLVTILAVVAITACAMGHGRYRRELDRLLLWVGIASLALIALVVPEFTARVPFDMASFVGFSWGAIVGLGLAVVSSVGAWFAWATFRFPWRWGATI